MPRLSTAPLPGGSLAPVTIWIDPPHWEAHGTQWSHVISDLSISELHDFARRAGIPDRSFEGDHYDVPAHRHADLVRAGAVPTSANDLARRLARSGLRFRKRRGERPLGRWSDALSAVGGPHLLDVVASPHEPPRDAGAAVVLITDPEGWLVLVRSVTRPGWAPPGGKTDPGEDARAGAVREVREETGLVLARDLLRPVGYERITIPPGQAVPPWDEGANHIAVFGARAAQRLPVAPHADDVVAAEWVSPAVALARSGHEPWWELVSRWLSRPGGR